MRTTAPALALSGLLLAGTLAGCGGSDAPAVCGAVDDLQSSIASVKDIDITSGSALDDLKSTLSAIGDDLNNVKKDADSEFATQVDGVESALNALRTGVKEAAAAPSTAAIAAVATTLSTFTSAVKTLVGDIQATC